jgi:hypothetical protein
VEFNEREGWVDHLLYLFYMKKSGLDPI